MKLLIASLVVLTQLEALFLDTPGPALGLVVPAPQPAREGVVAAERLSATVRVVDGIASTRLLLTISNSGSAPAEATWLLPLPEGSAADQFRMTMNGKLTDGEVLDAGRARGVYEGIVRSRRDPGLLEYVGRGCLRARVFPIPANGKLDVEVTYRELLPVIDGLRRWSFPLATGIEGQPPTEVVLDLELESSRGLQHVFSHTDGVDVIRRDARRARATFEGRGAALKGRELAVLYSSAESDFGIDVLSTGANGAGTFLLLFSPRADLDAEQVLPRRVVFAIDTSGSMKARKIEQARGALRAFLSSLTPRDEFNVVTYSSEAQPFFERTVSADPEYVQSALRRVAKLQAAGGTSIDHALRTSLGMLPPDPARVPLIVFLTDGVPSVDETSPQQLLLLERELNLAGARVFAFGVGHDVNTQLLDTLAEQSGASRIYVQPEQDIAVAASELFSQLSDPVLTNLTLAIEGITVERLTPRRLSDLYRGGRLAVFGRYQGAGPALVRLSGDVRGQRREFSCETRFAEAPRRSLEFIEALWAERRAATLLDQIRLHGADPELIDEVRSIGIEHGIVTPYTSHLILEEGLRLDRGTARAPGSPGGSGGNGPASPGSGGPATPGPTPRGGTYRGPSDTAGAPSTAALLDTLGRRLQEAGALPKDARPEQLRELAQTVANELLAADAALAGLGRDASGSRAVADSSYLARLVNAGSVTTGADDFFIGRGEQRSTVDLVELFTRRIRAKTFALRDGVWTDRAIGGQDLPRTRTESFSDAWFALLESTPALLPYFAFSERLDVLHEGTVYEVRPAPKPTEPEPTGR